jgi:hypothetical protein
MKQNPHSPNINLHIERLILDGLPIAPNQRPLIQAVVETELARLLTTNGLATELQTSTALRSLPAGNIQLTNDNNPHTLGRQIAQTVYHSIGGDKK